MKLHQIPVTPMLFASHRQAISDAVATTTPPTPLPTAQLEGAASLVPCSPPTPGPVAPLVTLLLLQCPLLQSKLITRGRIYLFRCNQCNRGSPQSLPPIRGSLHPPNQPSLPPLFPLFTNSFTIHRSVPFHPPTLTNPTSYIGPSQHYLHCQCPRHQ